MVIGSLVWGIVRRAVTAGGDVVFMSKQSLPVVGFPQGYPSGGADEVYEFQAASEPVVLCVV